MIVVPRILTLVSVGVLSAILGACTPDYSPNTYSSNAVQQANKVEPAVVVGYREVAISANGTVGAVTGGAAGGILGSQSGEIGLNAALGGVAGTAIGGLVGNAVEHATGDTTGWEYIVRKPNGDLLSVTQREPTPLAIGQKVLVITGAQARIIPDYSISVEPPKDKAETKPEAKPADKAAATVTPASATAPAPAAASTAATPAADATKPAPAADAVAPSPPVTAAAPVAAAPAAPTPITPTAGAPTAATDPQPAAAPASPPPAAPLSQAAPASDSSQDAH